ncbi:hypothetical protein TCAL_16848 [Tigriopus californicus]|uniref:Uncharacterized protein n=1 Tax=Tigriopus californicus TaxID=6832 RepID=A0A553PDX6_TIGCA|nr:hypothetical protein TCAL_16848 [Tigriopus californicus]
MSITVSSYHLEHSISNGQQRHIEGSAAQIKDQDILLAGTLVIIEAIGDSSGRRASTSAASNTGSENAGRE